MIRETIILQKCRTRIANKSIFLSWQFAFLLPQYNTKWMRFRLLIFFVLIQFRKRKAENVSVVVAVCFRFSYYQIHRQQENATKFPSETEKLDKNEEEEIARNKWQCQWHAFAAEWDEARIVTLANISRDNTETDSHWLQRFSFIQPTKTFRSTIIALVLCHCVNNASKTQILIVRESPKSKYSIFMCKWKSVVERLICYKMQKQFKCDRKRDSKRVLKSKKPNNDKRWEMRKRLLHIKWNSFVCLISAHS